MFKNCSDVAVIIIINYRVQYKPFKNCSTFRGFGLPIFFLCQSTFLLPVGMYSYTWLGNAYHSYLNFGLLAPVIHSDFVLWSYNVYPAIALQYCTSAISILSFFFSKVKFTHPNRSLVPPISYTDKLNN